MEQTWEQIWEVGLVFITWLQTTYPQLQDFFTFVTNLGNDEFYLALFPLIYWCLNKQAGKLLGYVFFVSVFVNSIMKQAFRDPRPFWVDANVGLDTREEGYGLPSGHTQNATILYIFLAAWLRRFWFWLFAFFMIFLMGLSRIYLGAHFVTDVLGGFLLALLILAIFAFWQDRYGTNFGKRILGRRLMVAIILPVILVLVFIAVRLIIGVPDMDVPWASYIPAAERASVDGVAQAFGLVAGFGIGIVLEGSRVRFRANGFLWKRVVRYIVGIIVLVAIWAGLKEIFPEDPIWLAVPLRALRYFLAALWAAYFAPWLFVRLGLAEADPEPQIDLSLR